MDQYKREVTPAIGQNHTLQVNNRKTLEITGVKEVDSFDNEEFLLETVMGYLIIRGEYLQLNNLDVNKGIVSIKGKVYDISYVDEQSQEKAKGFFSKLFR